MPALSEIVNQVRETTGDIEAVQRVRDADMIVYANDFVRELALARPDLFAVSGDIDCSPDTVLQSAPAAALVLVDIFQVKLGRVVTESKRAHLDRFNKNWQNDTAGEAECWMRHDKDQRKFFIYPKAPTSQTLVGQWAQLPAAMTALTDQIPTQVHEAYLPAMHHYMVFRAESRPADAAKPDNGRAALFYDGYAGLVGIGKATKKEAEQPEKERADRPHYGS